ncbi:hypothetical protein A7D35_20395 [Xanthomonas arboricola]|uniref:hypothetical protein n=1 Tax=Xanthomonas arboricola TaxID=56448 RepID=UPI0007ECE143|nr:hypothetical protein [Xanthomonas arboricola]OBR70624.1 hypothetical protein A7D35_20395 [Xanthomonas arboricola]
MHPDYLNEPMSYFPGLEGDYTINQVRELIYMARSVNCCAAAAANMQHDEAIRAIEAADLLLGGATRMLAYLFPDDDLANDHDNRLDARAKALADAEASAARKAKRVRKAGV